MRIGKQKNARERIRCYQKQFVKWNDQSDKREKRRANACSTLKGGSQHPSLAINDRLQKQKANERGDTSLWKDYSFFFSTAYFTRQKRKNFVEKKEKTTQ